MLIQQQTQAPSTNQTVTGSNWAGVAQIAVATANAGSSATANRNVAWAPAANSAHVAQVGQWNSGVSSASSINWESTLQWIQQFQNAGTSTGQDEEAVNLLATLQSAVTLSVTWQAQNTNLNDLLVPAGSRATNPSVSQSNIDSSTTNSVNVDQTQQWISQFQNGESDLEGSLAGNESATTQSNLEGMTASQLTLVNRAGWLGVEPPVASDGPLATGTVLVETSTVTSAPLQWISGLPGLGTVRAHQTRIVSHWHLRIPPANLPSPGGTAARECTTGCDGATPQGAVAAQNQIFSAPATDSTGTRKPAARHHHADSADSAASSAPGQYHLPLGGFGKVAPGSAPPSGGSGSLACLARSYKLWRPPLSSGRICPHRRLGRRW